MMANNESSITAATSFSSLNYDDGQCAICLGPHVDKSHLNCGHVFCYDCLVEWCKVKLQCPTCKRPFTSILHNIGSPDGGQRIYTPEPPFSLLAAGYYMQLFALMLSDPEFRRGISQPEVIRQVENFRRVLSDPQVILAFDDPAFRSQLNNPEFGRTFDDPEVNRILSDPEFRIALEEIVCEVLDDDDFQLVLSYPDLRRSFLNDWSQVINSVPLNAADPIQD